MKLRFHRDAQRSGERHSSLMSRLTQTLTVGLVAMMPLLFSLAKAQQHEPQPCFAPVSSSSLTVPEGWRVVADASTGLAVLLPKSHELAPNEGMWYAYGTLDGEPLVPDISIRLHRNGTAEEVAGDLFRVGAELEPVTLGPATYGFRAVVSGHSSAEGYLAIGVEGIYSIVRYEEFDWASFDQVACSFHFIELVSGQDGL